MDATIKKRFFSVLIPPSPITDSLTVILILIPILILIYSWAEPRPSICYEFLKLCVHPTVS